MSHTPPPTAIDLKPCPFCGRSNLVLREDYSEDAPVRAYAWHVFCEDCHCHGRNNFPIGWAETKEAAADAWNRRSLDTADGVEPVAWMTEATDGLPLNKRGTTADPEVAAYWGHTSKVIPLFASPPSPAEVTVTDAMVEALARSHYDQRMGRVGAYLDAPSGTRATERNYAHDALTEALQLGKEG